jgi:hypothetical protein
MTTRSAIDEFADAVVTEIARAARDHVIASESKLPVAPAVSGIFSVPPPAPTHTHRSERGDHENDYRGVITHR